MVAIDGGKALASFAARFGGVVLTPRDDGYDEVRALWNGSFDKRPAVIARCRATSDVVAVVRFVRESGLPLAVRGGGHSLAGLSSCDDGIMLDLSLMRGVEVDVEARTARVQPGATWADFDTATQAHGLASTGGLISHTGVGGPRGHEGRRGGGVLGRRSGGRGSRARTPSRAAAGGRRVRSDALSRAPGHARRGRASGKAELHAVRVHRGSERRPDRHRARTR